MMTSQNTLVLRPNREPWALLFVGMCVLVAVGAVMIASGDLGTTRVMDWVAVVFFGMAGVFAVAQLVTNRYLELTPEGFTVQALGWHYTIRWADVEGGFSAVTPSKLYPSSFKLVVYNFTPSYRLSLQARSHRRVIAGYESGLPETYGMKAEVLAALMNEWRARYTNS